jgi:phosphoserine phosphatase
MSGSVSMNEGKAAAMQRWADHNGLAIDWSSSYAYGDGGGDAHMLEMVGHPVAVYPDESLKAVAEQRGWQIIGEREPKT